MLSHLGAGAEIMAPTLDAARRGTVAEPLDTPALWDRWNAMSPDEQAADFLDLSERVVAILEGLDADDRANLRVDISFLPEPVDVSTVAALRLNELDAARLGRAGDGRPGGHPRAHARSTCWSIGPAS